MQQQQHNLWYWHETPCRLHDVESPLGHIAVRRLITAIIVQRVIDIGYKGKWQLLRTVGGGQAVGLYQKAQPPESAYARGPTGGFKQGIYHFPLSEWARFPPDWYDKTADQVRVPFSGGQRRGFRGHKEVLIQAYVVVIVIGRLKERACPAYK